MDRTTLILPISRDNYLNEFLTSIELLECDQNKISVLAIVDGSAELYVKVRNYFNNLKYPERLVVQFKTEKPRLEYDILSRRLRISEIHNFAKEYVKNTQYVMVIEDDTIVPQDAYKKLHSHYLNFDSYAGFIQGVEVGRWGIKYLGSWLVNDIYNPTEIQSTKLKEGIHKVDAGGFYCFMTKSEYYLNHDFVPFEGNELGPDVDYGIKMRQLGLENYTDYSIKCIHKTPEGDIKVNNEIESVMFRKNEQSRWRQSHV